MLFAASSVFLGGSVQIKAFRSNGARTIANHNADRTEILFAIRVVGQFEVGRAGTARATVFLAGGCRSGTDRPTIFWLGVVGLGQTDLQLTAVDRRLAIGYNCPSGLALFAPFSALSHGCSQKKTFQFSIRSPPSSRSSHGQTVDDLSQVQYHDANARHLPNVRVLHGPHSHATKRRIVVRLI